MNETKCPNCGWSKTYEIDKSNSYNLLIEVSNENERLVQQLQAYKDKEDKLRDYIKEYNTKDWNDNGNDIEYYKGYNAGCKDTIYDVNSILNEEPQ